MTDKFKDVRQLIVRFGAELYDRQLTDAAGGNISVRVDDRLLMTPTRAGSLYHWHLRPEQILMLDLKGRKLDGDGEISREAKVHLKLLNEFYPDGTAVVHGHARNVMVFCAAEASIPPVLYSSVRFGEIQQCVDAPSGTDALADNIAEVICGQEDRIRKQAALVMAPRHGLFALGKDLYAAFDAVQRADTNAYCLLMGRGLFKFRPLDHVSYEDTE
jgi:L-fuculose-phosphate aldolase